MDACMWYASLNGKLQPISRPDALPRRVWRVRWAQGGVCPAVSERYNIEVLPRSVCRDGKLQPISRPDVLPRSDAERLERSVGPGVCPAVSGRYKRGAAAERLGFGAFGGPRAGCVRQLRSGTIEVVPRSGRDGKRNAMRQWKQSGHRSGKANTKGGPRRRPGHGVGG